MIFSRRAMVAGRVVLSASALAILTALPDILATAGPARRAALMAGIVVFVVGWLAFWWFGIGTRNRSTTVALVAFLTAMLAVLTYLAPPGRDGLLLAAVAAGTAFEPRRAAPMVGGIALLAGAVQLLHGGGALIAAGATVNDLVVGAVAVGGRLLYVTSRSLTRARDEIARLAVSEERLRLARDLHDLLGQNLTLAVLKNELIVRDMPAETPEALKKTQLELGSAIRQSLDDVRLAVAGYRSTDLRAELDGTRAALGAAGIDFSIEDDLGVLPAVQDGVLAWALRESTTNVIRHSQATHCVVRLRRRPAGATLVVEDNGRGAVNAEEGSGLAGIAERAAAIGGSLDATQAPGGGFRMTVSVPLPDA
ncbi:MAG TPA: sensor histidine kinase [Candidatus Dormibacteraeota bacterium]|jgi:two-component system sensor histidine kinase DesK